MIARAAGWLLRGYARSRRRALEETYRNAASMQEATLLRLVATARDTAFGRAHDFPQRGVALPTTYG